MYLAWVLMSQSYYLKEKKKFKLQAIAAATKKEFQRRLHEPC